MSGRKKEQRSTGTGRGRTPAAGARFWRELYPEIRAWFAARVNPEQEADDLTEEVFVVLSAKDRSPDDPKVYIGVAKNILARYRRRATKERAILAGLLAEALRTGDGRGRRAPGGGRYEDGRLPASRGQTVAQVLATLPAEEAKLLRLRFLEGLRVAEVARRIGCTRAAAYKRLQRIIHRLRQRYGVEPPATKKPRE